MYYVFVGNFVLMPDSFSKQFIFEKRTLLAVIVPQFRKDGLYYEVNIKGFPRFFMTWTALGRYDVAGEDIPVLPYDLVLAVSDIIEEARQ